MQDAQYTGEISEGNRLLPQQSPFLDMLPDPVLAEDPPVVRRAVSASRVRAEDCPAGHVAE